MRWPAAFAGVMLAVALGGCVDGDESEPAARFDGGGGVAADVPAAEVALPNGSQPQPVPSPVAVLSGCTLHAGGLLVREENLRGEVPPGFTTTGLALAGVRFALLIATGIACPAWALDGEDQGPLTSFSLVMRVSPPEKYRDENVTGFYFLATTFAPEGPYADILREWGAGGSGTATVEFAGATGGGPFRASSSGSDGTASATVTGAGQLVPTPLCGAEAVLAPLAGDICGGGHVDRFFVLNGTEVVGAVDSAWGDGFGDSFADGASVVRMAGWRHETSPAGEPGFGQFVQWPAGAASFTQSYVDLRNVEESEPEDEEGTGGGCAPYCGVGAAMLRP